MQPTKSRPGSLNGPRKTSPTASHTGRKLKTPGSDSDSLSSPSHVRKTPKDTSDNVVVDHRSPRSPAAEKKKPMKVFELESELAHLQDELKNANDQLSSSESCKKKAQQEADEAKSQLAAILAEHEKTQKQLNELYDSEDARIRELRKISQDRDKAWQSELEAVQKQHSMDSAALYSALNEIHRLKNQLNKISESEVSQARRAESADAEIHSLRVELAENLELVEKLKSQLRARREPEARSAEEILKSENGNVIATNNSLSVELEESKSKVSSLEGLVSKFEAENGECDRIEMLKADINNLKNEASQIKEALDDAEERYRGQYSEMTIQIKHANEFVTHAKMESCEREAQLKESRAEFEKLKTKSIEKEKASRQRETELRDELKKSESFLQDLKASLLVKEMQLQSIKDENETLKSEIVMKEIEKSKGDEETLASAEEADRSRRKAEWLTEQLNAAQAASLEMEADLRRLKVQSDQWRKAAEAAAAMLSTGNNGKYVEKMGNLDYQTMGSPFSDDGSAVKKNGNVLKKIGEMLKKGQR